MASDPESRGERETWILSPCTVQTRQAFPLDLPQGALPPPPWDLTKCTSASHSQLCVRGGPVGGFLCVCLLGKVRAPDPGEVSQLLSVEVSSKK